LRRSSSFQSAGNGRSALTRTGLRDGSSFKNDDDDHIYTVDNHSVDDVADQSTSAETPNLTYIRVIHLFPATRRIISSSRRARGPGHGEGTGNEQDKVELASKAHTRDSPVRLRTNHTHANRTVWLEYDLTEGTGRRRSEQLHTGAGWGCRRTQDVCMCTDRCPTEHVSSTSVTRRRGRPKSVRNANPYADRSNRALRCRVIRTLVAWQRAVATQRTM